MTLGKYPLTFIAKILLAILLVLQPISPAMAKKKPVYVTSVEVTLKKEKIKRGAEMVPLIQKALLDEAAYYEAAGTPVTMRFRIDKLTFHSKTKEILGAIPLVDLFTGSNRTGVKGRVELVDPATGKIVKKFKLEADESVLRSSAESIFEAGIPFLSFLLPAGDLIGDGVLALAASARREKLSDQGILTQGVTMMAYGAIYDGKSYKRAQKNKKAAALAAADAAKTKTVVQPMTEGAEVPVAAVPALIKAAGETGPSDAIEMVEAVGEGAIQGTPPVASGEMADIQSEPAPN